MTSHRMDHLETISMLFTLNEPSSMKQAVNAFILPFDSTHLHHASPLGHIQNKENVLYLHQPGVFPTEARNPSHPQTISQPGLVSLVRLPEDSRGHKAA
jgi:hypothetical protein